MKTQTLKTVVFIIALVFGIQVNAQSKNQNRQKPGFEKIIKKLDTNKDGLISKEEAKKGERKRISENFDKIDSDSDGFITLEELKAMRKKKKQ